jgi:hypothetical protein
MGIASAMTINAGSCHTDNYFLLSTSIFKKMAFDRSLKFEDLLANITLLTIYL